MLLTRPRVVLMISVRVATKASRARAAGSGNGSTRPKRANLFASIGSFLRLRRFDPSINRGLATSTSLPVLQPGGSIVLNASIVSTTGSPAFSVYSATKAAVRSFARTWSVDLKERKIRVNAISPGIIPTPGYNSSLGMTQEQVDQVCAELDWQYSTGPSRHRG